MADHETLIRTEFSRQAGSMDTARVFNDADILARIRQAAALTHESRALDVACGPGIVAEAVAHDAAEVVACDITPEMLARAARRFAKAGLTNVRCLLAKAEKLPLEDGSFDAVLNRSALHHFPHPALALIEMARVLRPSGRVVILDVISSEDPDESALHNALETVRDPSHVRMLPKSELLAHLRTAGLQPTSIVTWTNHREFDEWVKIVNAPERVEPLRIIMKTLAKAGMRGGINLRLEQDGILFEHSPLLVVAEKRQT